MEQATGLPFEKYVEEAWFRPLGMPAATYFKPRDESSAQLYRADGLTPYPYLKIKTRPSGSVLASHREMGNVVRFLLNRGRWGGRELLPAADIERMERATSTYAARQGLPGGYGLGNYTALRGGWAYLGHEGGLPGALTEPAYLPRERVGYVVMLNSLNFTAARSITSLIRNYLTQELPLPEKPRALPIVETTAANFSGWYEPVSPRAEYTRCVGQILGLSRFSLTGEALFWEPLRGKPQTFLAVSEFFFRHQSVPVPTLALIADRSEGTFIQTAGADGRTFQQVPLWKVWLKLALTGGAVFFATTTLGLSLVWIPQRISRGQGSVSCPECARPGADHDPRRQRPRPVLFFRDPFPISDGSHWNPSCF